MEPKATDLNKRVMQQHEPHTARGKHTLSRAWFLPQVRKVLATSKKRLHVKSQERTARLSSGRQSPARAPGLRSRQRLADAAEQEAT